MDRDEDPDREVSLAERVFVLLVIGFVWFVLIGGLLYISHCREWERIATGF